MKKCVSSLILTCFFASWAELSSGVNDSLMLDVQDAYSDSFETDVASMPSDGLEKTYL